MVEKLKKFRKKLSILFDKITTQILELCKIHQEGCGVKNTPNGVFAFTEYWFRTSGINRKRTKSDSDFVQRDSFVSDSILR